MSKLTINKCPTHGFLSVSIDNEFGGVRVTPGKCCGRWELVKEWELSPRQWQDLIEEATQANHEPNT